MPGVPPNALTNLKRMLKGMFKRKSKNQDQEQKPAQPAIANDPTRDVGPPDMNKQLPSPQDEVQSSAPQGPSLQAASASGMDEVSEDSRRVSAVSAPTGGFSEPVSAVESERPPLPPPKNDEPTVNTTVSQKASDKDVPKVEDEAVETSENNEDRKAPATTSPATATDTAPAAASIPQTGPSQTAKPDNTSEDVKPTQTTPLGPPSVEKDPPISPKTKVSDDQAPPVDEGLPTRTDQSQHGMSATSGPLEDFPVGDSME